MERLVALFGWLRRPAPGGKHSRRAYGLAADLHEIAVRVLRGAVALADVLPLAESLVAQPTCGKVLRTVTVRVWRGIGGRSISSSGLISLL